MNKKRVLLILITILILISTPIYSQGYENISKVKLFFQLVFYLIIFIAVIFITLYGTKFIAQNTKEISSSKYTSLLDVTNIPGGSKIIIAEINNMIYILSTNNSGTHLIDKIEKKDFVFKEEDVDTYLDKYLIENKLDYENIKVKIKTFIKKMKNKED